MLWCWLVVATCTFKAGPKEPPGPPPGHEAASPSVSWHVPSRWSCHSIMFECLCITPRLTMHCWHLCSPTWVSSSQSSLRHLALVELHCLTSGCLLVLQVALGTQLDRHGCCRYHPVRAEDGFRLLGCQHDDSWQPTRNNIEHHHWIVMSGSRRNSPCLKFQTFFEPTMLHRVTWLNAVMFFYFTSHHGYHLSVVKGFIAQRVASRLWHYPGTVWLGTAQVQCRWNV